VTPHITTRKENIMIRIQKVARHAGSGRFVTKEHARRYFWLTVVETMRIRIPPRGRLRKR
jgi:hypothetical protein